jgi:2-dehydropantoate 2-reductase
MNFRIAVVGSGAIGSYYGAKLAYGGSDVHFLMRGDLNEVRAAGLYVRGKSENFRLASMPRLEIVYALLKSVGETERGKNQRQGPPIVHHETRSQR